MRWLINYLRQCFCRHDFKSDVHALFDKRGDIVTKQVGIKTVFTCQKCGYQKHNVVRF